MKSRPQQTREMKLTHGDGVGGVGISPPLPSRLWLPGNKFDSQCPSAPAGWLPRGPPCLP